MNSDEIRTTFVRYFESQGHLYVPSAPVVVHGDPSVLFTVAGMQPFRDYYVDPSRAPARRLVSVQRCVRTNDIDEVGDNTHHTVFEMAGNFAFGELEDGGYFKKEAIAFGWEVVTREYGLPAARLWATTWAGEPGIPADDEAVALWRAIGVPAARIVPLNKKPDGSRENFWGPTGDTGPCGPCSEIHFEVLDACPLGDADCKPGDDCGRFVEIWNLVFNQFYQEQDKSLRPLERTGIDTGSGFERVVSLLAGAPSAYETDLLQPIVRAAENALDAPYGEDPGATRSLRIIADHTRAVTFMVGDGVTPSNEARGYVVRRLVRRAVRHGRVLGHHGTFLRPVIAATIDRFAPHYPHLRDRQPMIEQVIAQEEARFSETLSAGLERLNAELDRVTRTGGTVLPGPAAFTLYDTFGFPLELTREVVAGRGYSVDEAGFDAELQAQRVRARSAARFAEQAPVDLPSVRVAFEGYDRLEVDGARVEFIGRGGERVGTAGATDAASDAATDAATDAAGEGATDAARTGADQEPELAVVLDRTPFYAERGGQVGDAGVLVGPHGRMEVTSTRPGPGDVTVHYGRVVEGALTEGETVRAQVTESARRATMRHHTATHLLHAALREVLGPQVHQAGSLVAPDRLRFDFSWGEPLSAGQRAAIQARVNDAIRRNLEVHTDVLPLSEAMKSGAIALFDERYGDSARVLTIGDFSKELCGGTHVARTGEIGTFVLVGEASVGSGMRRIEALAGEPAEAYVGRQLDALDEAARVLAVPREQAPARAQQVLAELAAVRRRLEAAERRAAQAGIGALLAQAQDVPAPEGLFKVLAAEVDAAAAPTIERLREASDWLRDKLGVPSVLVLASVPDSRPQLLVVVSKELTGRGLQANKLLGEINQEMGSRGGGRPELAQGGGGDPDRLESALRRAQAAALAQAGAR